MENKNAQLQYGAKWGFILGLVGIIIQVLCYVINKELLVTMSFGFSVLAITIAILVYALINYRKENGGVLTFKEGFMITLYAFIVSSLLTTIFNYILYNFIDPDLSNFIKEKAINTTTQMMEKFGAPQDKIDETIEKMQSQDFSQNLYASLKQFLGSIIFGAIIALILAAILKKQPKVGEDNV